MDRGVDARRDAENHRDQRAGEDQFQRARQPERDFLQNGVVIDERGAEIAPHQAGEEPAVLRQQRLVETELLAQLRDRRRIGHGARTRQEQFGGIARHHVEGHEDDRRDEPRRQQREQGATGEPGRAHEKKVCSSMLPEELDRAPGRLTKPEIVFAMP